MDIKAEFQRIVYRDIERPGIEALMDWLENTDFYVAPASTRYHGVFEGGLALHSLNVHSQLLKLCEAYDFEVSAETAAIVSLLHDLCKIGCYKVDMRWRKNAEGRWEQYPTWKFDEDFAYGGHGSKSVFLIQSFMRLTPDEASAINCHMGAWDSTTYSNPTVTYQRNKLAWLLHVADEAANFFVDKEE